MKGEMMTVMDYCIKVQLHVKASKPDGRDPLFSEWFGDTGRASMAVTAALECRDDDALQIAEPLAERYNLP